MTVYSRVSHTKKELMRRRRLRIFGYVCRYIETHYHAPAEREIADALKLTRRIVHEDLDRMVVDGLIVRGDYGSYRTIMPALRTGLPCPVCKKPL